MAHQSLGRQWYDEDRGVHNHSDSQTRPAKKKTRIQDGIYFLHPEGSCWIAAQFRCGRMVDQTEEANADTHWAAKDRWSGVIPRDDHAECDQDESAAIVREVMGEDVDADMVIVTRMN